MRLLVAFLAALLLVGPAEVSAQPAFIPPGPPAGFCQLPYGQSLLLQQNGWAVGPASLFNVGAIWQDGVHYHRDSAGAVYWDLDAGTNGKKYAVGWQGELFVEDATGSRSIVGACTVSLPLKVGQPSQVPPYAANWDFDPTHRFIAPMIANETDVQGCAAAATVGSSEFADCVVRKMGSDQTVAIYDCVRVSSDPAEQSLCAVGAFGGKKERELAAEVGDCYEKHGTDYGAYPLCFTGSKLSNDQKRLIACVESQEKQTGQVSILGVAMCYGSDQFKMNAEAQVALQCAVVTGGDPYEFAGCAGGTLTKMELAKCQTQGIGGDGGCFGKNNTIVQYLKGMGLQLPAIFGPANPLVKKWNDAVEQVTKNATRGSVEALRDVGNAIIAAPPAVVSGISSQASDLLPEIRVAKPKLVVGKFKLSL